MTITCPCGEPITEPGRYLCRDCEQALVGRLSRVPDLLAELETEVARQAVKAPSPGATGAGVGFDVEASETTSALLAVLDGLERLGGIRTRRADPRQRVRGIVAALHLARRRPDITGWAADLADAVARAVRKIDQQAERVDLGLCQCGERLITARGAQWAKCRACGAAWQVAQLVEDRREAMMDELSEACLRSCDIGTALAALGHDVAASTVQSWIRRGRLEDQGGRTYKVGDALDLAERRALATA